MTPSRAQLDAAAITSARNGAREDVMRAIVCSFESLADLPEKKHGSERSVLRAIRATSDARGVCRFSVFDATSTDAIAGTLDALTRKGRVVAVGGAYPWTECIVTKRAKKKQRPPAKGAPESARKSARTINVASQ